MKTMQSRRDFVRLSAAGTLGALLLSNYSCDKKAPYIGIQLYTIRDAMAEDVKGSLKRIADLGFSFIELADYSNGRFYGYSPEEFLKIVRDLGMDIISSHTQVEGVGVTSENAGKMAEDHAKIGVKYCVQPWIVEEMRTTIESYQRMAANWNQIGAIMKEYGIMFGYHNHNFEFATVEGKVPYFDVMLAELDRELVTMELDMFWASKAGHNPVDIIKKYPGRFQLFHLKDMYTSQEPFFDVIKDDIAPVGEGVINFGEIIDAGDTAGMKYMIVEQDQSRDGDMWADVAKSIKNLTSRILA